jgi:predicted branched-subunit amino acid permease/uncharacterized membrane protein
MPSSSFTAEVQRGARTFLPVALSVAAYGLVWGVLAGQARLSVLEVLAMSSLVFAGSSQFVALTMWTPAHLPIFSIVVAVAIVNVRMILLSATLRPLLGDLPLRRSLPAIFFVADEQWAVTMAEVHRGRGSVGFYVGTAVLTWAAWVGSTVAGRLLGSAIADPAQFGLDFAFTATFIALLLGCGRVAATSCRGSLRRSWRSPCRGSCQATGTSLSAGSRGPSPEPCSSNGRWPMSLEALVTILGMAAVTYAIRAGGLLIASRLPQTGFAARFMRNIPGAVLAALVAPALVSGGMAGLLAAAATALVFVLTRSLLPAMVAGVGAVYFGRLLLGA